MWERFESLVTDLHQKDKFMTAEKTSNDRLPAKQAADELAATGSLDATGSLGPTGSLADANASGVSEARLAAILDDYLARVEAGQSIDQEAFIAEHPEDADALRACLGGLDFIAGQVAPPAKAAFETTSDASSKHSSSDLAFEASSRQLSDFEIVRELGRGGMGAVYLAKQVSLGREVALKILGFGAIGGSEALERFQREAETVARLHHTNIVPIYSVGSENGIHFYAMQFIQGRDLSVVNEQSEQLQSPRRAAEWALQAAEALAHAHQRNVVHRDVKPSNLILDEDDRIWLTDFGLAKRNDDLAISMTGAVLGTPRYMSPEQAAGHDDVDARSDLFSLGATVYELLTDQPAFDGSSHWEVIEKIRNEAVIAPRQLRPGISRDLETIVLKCLKKEPSQRYPSARQLADDLRAYLDGRAISARRSNVLQKAVRWARQNQRRVKRSAATVLATCAVLAMVVFGWQAYQGSQACTLRLEGAPSVVATIHDTQATGAVVDVQSVSLPMPQATVSKSGDRQIEVQGGAAGRRTYQLDLIPGQEYEIEIPSEAPVGDESPLLPNFYALWQATQQARLVCFDPQGIQLRDLSGQLLWQASDVGDGFRPGGVTLAGDSAGQSSDFNQDGQEDLVLASDQRAALVVLNGDDGSLLWRADGFDQTVTVPNRDSAQAAKNTAEIQSALVQPPRVVSDLNADGVPDVVVTGISHDPSVSIDCVNGDPGTARWVAAVSGTDGELLWQAELDFRWFATQLNSGDGSQSVAVGAQEVPDVYRYFPSGSFSVTEGRSGGTSFRDGLVFRDVESIRERHGEHVMMPDACHVINGVAEGLPTGSVALMAGSHLVHLDSQTGKILWQHDTQRLPTRSIRWTDCDGDQVDDAILIDQPGSGGTRCSVWSLAKQTLLWQKDLAVYDVHADWPLVTDLDGDGKAECVLASKQGGTGESLPWSELICVDAATGGLVWSRKQLTMDMQVDHFKRVADFDQDGVADLVIATLWGERFEPYLDVVSGKDGNTLASWGLPTQLAEQATVGQLLTREARSNSSINQAGRTEVLIQYQDAEEGGRSVSLVVDLANGDLLQRINKTREQWLTAETETSLARFVVVHDLGNPGQGRSAKVLEQESIDWRRLADSDWQVAHDLNQDGIRDLLYEPANGFEAAVSGSTGETLWKFQATNFNDRHWATETAADRLQSNPNPQTAIDIDADQVGDLLCWYRTGAGTATYRPIECYSGQSGDLLWQADVTVHTIEHVALLRWADLDQDDRPEVIVVAAMDYQYPTRRGFSTSDLQLWLLVLDGQTGKLRWDQPLTAAYGTATGLQRQYQFKDLSFQTPLVDLNQDGVFDLVLPSEREDRVTTERLPELAYEAFDGATGKRLWQYVVKDAGRKNPFLLVSPAVPVDLDRDGTHELLAMYPKEKSQGAGKPTQRLLCLTAIRSDGKRLWDYESKAPTIYQQMTNNPLDWRQPVVLRHPGESVMICSPFSSNESLDLLNNQGGVVQTIELPKQWGARVYSLDGDGDEQDELYLDSPQSLSCWRFQDQQLMQQDWSVPFGQAQQRLGFAFDQATVVGIQPGHLYRPSVLLHRSLKGLRLQGIDAATGKVQWFRQTAEPSSVKGAYRINEMTPLDGTLLPKLFVQFGDEAQGVWPTAVNAQVMSDPTAIAARPLTPINAAGLQDPRLQRSLPGKNDVQQIAGEVVRFWWLGLIYCALLVVSPIAWINHLIRHRKFSLRFGLLLPVIAALALMALAVRPTSLYELTVVQKFFLGVIYTPLIAVLFCAGSWLLLGRWKPLLIWSATCTSLALSVALLVMWLKSEPTVPGIAGQYYSYAGWYWLLAMWAYVSGLVLVFQAPATLKIWKHLVNGGDLAINDR